MEEQKGNSSFVARPMGSDRRTHQTTCMLPDSQGLVVSDAGKGWKIPVR